MAKKTHAPIVEEKPDTEQARQLILAERAQRRETCLREIDVILKKHRCRLDSVVVLRNGQVTTQIDIIPLD